MSDARPLEWSKEEVFAAWDSFAPGTTERVISDALRPTMELMYAAIGRERARAEKAEAERDEARRMVVGAYVQGWECVWCGEKLRVGKRVKFENASKRIAQHVLVCKKHPLRLARNKAEAALAAAVAELETICVGVSHVADLMDDCKIGDGQFAVRPAVALRTLVSDARRLRAEQEGR